MKYKKKSDGFLKGLGADIGLDELRIENKRCLSNDNQGNGLPFQCSFEASNLCGLIQSTTDNQNWVRRSGQTPTQQTGPSSASDGQYYLYLEADEVNINGARAEFVPQ